MLSKEYALALYDLGNDVSKITVFEEQLQILIDVINDDAELIKLMMHPKLKTSQKKSVISNGLEAFDEDFKHFLFVLVDNGRFDLLPDIHKDFITLMNESANIMVIQVFTAKELQKKELEALKVKLEKQYQKTVKIIPIVDEYLLDGLRLEFNGKVLDNSVRATLNDLKSKLY